MAHHRPITAPVTVRGHTLLCLQGFRGEGYSGPFIDNLAIIHGDLQHHPDRLVSVVEQPDAICGACPHHAGTGCELNGAGSEAAMRLQDRTVLARLGLSPGTILPWRDILERIRQRLCGDDLPAICGDCRWLPLGYCREGIERLRSDGATTASPSFIMPTKPGD